MSFLLKKKCCCDQGPVPGPCIDASTCFSAFILAKTESEYVYDVGDVYRIRIAWGPVTMQQDTGGLGQPLPVWLGVSQAQLDCGVYLLDRYGPASVKVSKNGGPFSTCSMDSVISIGLGLDAIPNPNGLGSIACRWLLEVDINVFLCTQVLSGPPCSDLWGGGGQEAPFTLPVHESFATPYYNPGQLPCPGGASWQNATLLCDQGGVCAEVADDGGLLVFS